MVDASVTSRYLDMLHTFSIEVHKFRKRRNEKIRPLAKCTGGMQKVNVAFKDIDDDHNPPSGNQFISVEISFALALNLKSKARYVAGGNKSEAPAVDTYARV
jgi:hypothetical protein